MVGEQFDVLLTPCKVSLTKGESKEGGRDWLISKFSKLIRLPTHAGP